jgi:hypothetical protein
MLHKYFQDFRAPRSYPTTFETCGSHEIRKLPF